MVVVPAVDLVEIDVIGSEAAQRTVDRRHDVLARQPAVVRVVAHRVEQFRRDDDGVAVGEVADRAAENLLGDAARIHVGGVEEVDAALERALEERAAGFFAQDPRPPVRIAVGHGSETDPRNLEAAPPEIHILHPFIGTSPLTGSWRRCIASPGRR